MKKNILISAVLALACALPLGAKAQQMESDLDHAGLRGDVQMMRETTRGTHGQVIGYPITNYYNAVGNLRRVVYCDTTGQELQEVRYKYDSLGVLIHTSRYRINKNEPIQENTYTRDRRKRTLTVEMVAFQDSLDDHIVYNFNKEGHVEDISNYDATGALLSRDFYKYDENNRCTEIIYTEGVDENYRRTEQFRYDSDGNTIECRTLHITTERQRLIYVYDFDTYGNWVKRHVYNITGKTAELLQVVSREIVYFE